MTPHCVKEARLPRSEVPSDEICAARRSAHGPGPVGVGHRTETSDLSQEGDLPISVLLEAGAEHRIRLHIRGVDTEVSPSGPARQLAARDAVQPTRALSSAAQSGLPAAPIATSRVDGV